MRRYFSMIFLCMIPFFAAIGHDIYLFMQNAENGFQFSAAGYVWTQYSPTSYAVFMTQDRPGLIEFITGILSIKFVVLMFILGILLPILMATEYFLLRLFFGRMGGGGAKAPGGGSRMDALLGRKTKVMQYKRK